MKLLSALAIVLLLCISCDSGLESDGEEIPIESGYTISVVNGDTGEMVDGQAYAGVETEWNLSSGIVVLGPEDVGEPLARLELQLVTSSTNPNQAIITSAILSTSNVRTGTSDEIDARLYVGGTPSGEEPNCSTAVCDACSIRSISQAHIATGSERSDVGCFFFMEKVSQGAGPELIAVSTSFTATDAE